MLFRTKDLQSAFDVPCGQFGIIQLANCELFDETKKNLITVTKARFRRRSFHEPNRIP